MWKPGLHWLNQSDLTAFSYVKVVCVCAFECVSHCTLCDSDTMNFRLPGELESSGTST